MEEGADGETGGTDAGRGAGGRFAAGGRGGPGRPRKNAGDKTGRSPGRSRTRATKIGAPIPSVSKASGDEAQLAADAADGVAVIASMAVEMATPDQPLTDDESGGLQFSIGLLARRWPQHMVTVLSYAAVVLLIVVMGIIVYRRVRHGDVNNDDSHTAATGG